jgi:hypothetical protein
VKKREKYQEKEKIDTFCGYVGEKPCFFLHLSSTLPA